MSKQFCARFEIFGAGEITPGEWEVIGDVVDSSPDAWTVFDVSVTDCFVDDNSFFGTNNRWKITEITTVGPTAYSGGNSNSIKIKAVWDDVGDMDINGPAAGMAFISRVSSNKSIMWEGYSAYLGGVTDGVMAKVRTINAFNKIDPFMNKYVKNQTGVTIPQYKLVAWEDDGSVALATATSHSLSDIAGVTTKAINDNEWGWLIKTGYIPNALSGLNAVPGDTIYLSETPGEMTRICPEAYTDTIIKIGRAEPPSGVLSSIANDLHMEMEVLAEP